MYYQYTEAERSTAMKTTRAAGAVSANAIVPKVVKMLVAEDANIHRVLDYGCGKDMVHANDMARTFPDLAVYGWDHSLSDGKPFRDAFRELRRPHLAYASNVLNVQSTIEGLRQTLAELRSLHCPVVVNYPTSPRKLGLSVKALEAELSAAGFIASRVGSAVVGKNVVWVMR